jgi:hypothetical protein
MSLFSKFKIDPKTPATSATTATFQPKCSESSNRSNPLGMDSGIFSEIKHSPDRGKSIQEATRLYRKRGWVQIFSGHLNQSIYLVRNKWVIVPDPALSKYTQDEIESLKGLSWEEAQTLHKAKVIFKGEIL